MPAPQSGSGRSNKNVVLNGLKVALQAILIVRVTPA